MEGWGVPRAGNSSVICGRREGGETGERNEGRRQTIELKIENEINGTS